MVTLPAVPTMAELHADRLAVAREWTKEGKPTVFTPTAEGQRMIYAAMHTRAERLKVAALRAIDPEGVTDMEQDRAERREPWQRFAQCPLVNQRTGMRCTHVAGHVEARGWTHNSDVTWETRAHSHARMVEDGGTW